MARPILPDALWAVVEQAISAVQQYRRLKVRYERRDDIHLAFLTLACVKAC